MKSNSDRYKEISKAQITESRNIVVSSYSRGGYTMAQQLVANEDGKKMAVFLQGAFHIDDIQGLYNLRDAINLAIKTAENAGEENDVDEDWD